MLRPGFQLRAVPLCQRCQLRPWSSRSYATARKAKVTTARSSDIVAASYIPPPSAQKTSVVMRTYKPRTPGIRHLKRPINDHLWKGRPIKKLTFPKKGQSRGGRNNSGQIRVRHRGGGHKRRIRTVDFFRMAPGQQIVERIEYDPNRTAHIALLKSTRDNKLSYIIAAEGMRAGDRVESYRKGIPDALMREMGGSVDPGVLAARTAWRGNCLPLHMVPIGTSVYNVSLTKDGGGALCRSAGTFATVISKGEETLERRRRDDESTALARQTEEGTMTAAELAVTQRIRADEWAKAEKAANFVTVRLQSGEVRLIHREACGTIGVASNVNYQYAQLGKAGRSRWLGIRPTVRGVAMNACDHPHGGGRGKSKGNVHPMSIWGKPAKSGYRTRSKKASNKHVVIPRERNQGKRRRGRT